MCVDLTVQFNERKGHISLTISVAAIVLGSNEKGNIIYMVTGLQVDKVIAFVTVQVCLNKMLENNSTVYSLYFYSIFPDILPSQVI